MRALVTGGAGFIGSNLVDALIARGDQVVVLDDLSSGRRENLAEALAAGAELIEGSVTDDEAITEAFDRARPEALFHFAAQIDVRRSVAEPVYDLELNVGGTVNLLESARRNDLRRFVFASTGGAIYGEGEGRDLPLDEAADCRPDAPYAQSKLAAEGYVGLYRRLHGLETTVLRLANVYGPRQDPRLEAGVVAIFCGALTGGARPTVFGDGEQTRDYVYVGDVAAAFATAAESGGPGPYNIGTGTETSVLELGRAIAAVAGTEFDPEFAELRPGEVRRSSIDPGLAAAEFGWRPATSLAEGIELTLAAVAPAQ
ncbi:MAG: UDP-glucose 4-epimerase [Solirubrobacterales bacterium]|jgi:UDP-glucose 4-epimerase|nr:UDP-glucose 4-epimerase [Solirubrobacterales bacterium]